MENIQNDLRELKVNRWRQEANNNEEWVPVANDTKVLRRRSSQEVNNRVRCSPRVVTTEINKKLKYVKDISYIYICLLGGQQNCGGTYCNATLKMEAI
jgi:hypothetical protein